MAPWEAEGLDWKAGMGEENLEEFARDGGGPGRVRAFLDAARANLIAITADAGRRVAGRPHRRGGSRAITATFAEWLLCRFARALANGSDGWSTTTSRSSATWGFDLGAIDVPVTIWQGDDDRMVPFAHGQWVAAHVRGARAELRRGEGHLSIPVARFGEILDDLIAVDALAQGARPLARPVAGALAGGRQPAVPAPHGFPRRPRIAPGDRLVYYASVWQRVFAVVEVVAEPEQRDHPRWPWIVRVEPLRDPRPRRRAAGRGDRRLRPLDEPAVPHPPAAEQFERAVEALASVAAR